VAGGACNRPPPEACSGATIHLVRKGVLTVGTDFANPPFTFDHPETGEPTGFEVQLVQAIADQLHVKLLLVNRTSAALIPGLLAHRHDLAVSALVGSRDLQRIACVSRPYQPADLGLLARAGEPPSVSGTGALEGRSIGVVNGSRSEAWAQENLPPTARLVSVEASEDLLTEFRARQIDGVVDDLSLLRFRQANANDLVVVDEIVTDEDYVMAASPENRVLLDAVNEALRRLRANGKLKALRAKWFGE
jgi:polar amino acid transport system substrate-binding protein